MLFEHMRNEVIKQMQNGFDEAVFVGRNQSRVISLEARVGSELKVDQDCDGDPRRQFMGLPMYVVDCDNFFKVA